MQGKANSLYSGFYYSYSDESVKKVRDLISFYRGFHNSILSEKGNEWQVVTLSGDKENKQIVATFGKPVLRRKLVKLSVGPLGPGSTTESVLPLGRFVNFTFSTCYPNKFTCASGHCVPLKYFFSNNQMSWLNISQLMIILLQGQV